AGPRSWPARFGRGFALPYPPVFLVLWRVDAPPPAALHGLPFRSAPERASDDQNILEPLGQRLILGRLHTGAGRRQVEAAPPHPYPLPRKRPAAVVDLSGWGI